MTNSLWFLLFLIIVLVLMFFLLDWGEEGAVSKFLGPETPISPRLLQGFVAISILFLLWILIHHLPAKAPPLPPLPSTPAARSCGYQVLNHAFGGTEVFYASEVTYGDDRVFFTSCDPVHPSAAPVGWPHPPNSVPAVTTTVVAIKSEMEVKP